MVKEKKSEVW